MKYNWQNHIEMLGYLQNQVPMTQNDMPLRDVSLLLNASSVTHMYEVRLAK